LKFEFDDEFISVDFSRSVLCRNLWVFLCV